MRKRLSKTDIEIEKHEQCQYVAGIIRAPSHLCRLPAYSCFSSTLVQRRCRYENTFMHYQKNLRYVSRDWQDSRYPRNSRHIKAVDGNSGPAAGDNRQPPNRPADAEQIAFHLLVVAQRNLRG